MNDIPVISAPLGFNIYLYKGWNMIGNPYTYQIPLSSIRLNNHGVTRTLDEDGESSNPWVQPLFYGYSMQGDQGHYVLVPPRDIGQVDPPGGVLEAYHGYWLRALVGGNTREDRLVLSVQ